MSKSLTKRGPACSVRMAGALTDAEGLDLADRQVVWCENWSDETRDCETLYTLRREADGTLISAALQNPWVLGAFALVW